MAEPNGELVADKLLTGLHLAVLAITAAVLPVFALPLLAAYPGVYRSVAQEVVAFALLTGTGVVAGVRVVRRRPLGKARWVLVVAVFTASVLATTGIPATELMSEQEWSYGVIGWFVLLLMVDYGTTAPAVLLGVHTVMSFAQLVLVGQGHEVADLVVVTAVVLGLQLPVLAAAAALRTLAATVVAETDRAERVRTADAVAEQLHADRRERFADLAATTVPLLTDLTTGRADLSDERVRAAYAVAAARLRRLFAEHDEVEDPLLHELAACVDPAERNGVVVHLETCGAGPTPPLEVRRALTEPVLEVVTTAGSRARVTVLGTPESVTVSVVADARVAGEGTDSDHGITVTRLVDGDTVWLEATWRTRT
ncbi:hypothetical protein [Saccharothrix obliqua]|uniref:hypothetical protein n=1 Tax=Saccharothrix obliqua TaxID=2861747 RepID=UPI001C5ED386|nr:hypothetical protein [Saccharothrix obliqua]MBW4721344.1 hypothetical protein [Saccharothrix obliqua]